MVDKQITSNGNTTVWMLLGNAVADYRSPTAAEINAGIDITPAIAWEGTTFPTASESEDIDDRSLRDKGNATSRGTAQYEATLSLFMPDNNLDNVSDYGRAYNTLRVPRVPVIIVTRVLQAPEGQHKDAAAGEWVSVYRFLSDGWTDDIEGDDANKYVVGMLTQGDVAVYTQVKNSAPIVVTNATGSASGAVGTYVVLRATMGGKRATNAVTWESSNLNVATVSKNGVVTRQAPGTAQITAKHVAATTSTPLTITVT